MEQPLVSVGVMNYNSASFLDACITSIANQTYANIELIIIDDCSNDNSLFEISNICAQYSHLNISVIRNAKNLGIAKSANILKEKFSGSYWMIIGSDDLLLPSKIEKCVKTMRVNRSAILCYSNLYWRYQILRFTFKFPHFSFLRRAPRDFKSLLIDCTIPTPTLFFSSHLTSELEFDDTFGAVCDYHYVLACYKRGSYSYINDCLVEYRRHGNNISRREAFIKERIKISRWAKKEFPEYPKELDIMRRRLYFYYSKHLLHSGAKYKFLKSLYQTTTKSIRSPVDTIKLVSILILFTTNLFRIFINKSDIK